MDNKKGSQLILPFLPENFENLNKEENQIRTKLILYINGNENLKAYLDLICSSVCTLMNFNIQYKNNSEDELTIQSLGGRLLNSTLASLKLLLSGYYQSSAAIMRDIIETGFLIDFLTFKPEEIKPWRECTDKMKRKKFQPFNIRKALDERGGFTSRKREKKYKLLCEYGTHPTSRGFELMSQNKLVKFGPFYDEEKLKALLEELYQIVPSFVLIFILFFNHVELKHLEIIVDFLKELERVYQKSGIFGICPHSKKYLKTLKALISRIHENQSPLIIL